MAKKTIDKVQGLGKALEQIVKLSKDAAGKLDKVTFDKALNKLIEDMKTSKQYTKELANEIDKLRERVLKLVEAESKRKTPKPEEKKEERQEGTLSEARAEQERQINQYYADRARMLEEEQNARDAAVQKLDKVLHSLKEIDGINRNAPIATEELGEKYSSAKELLNEMRGLQSEIAFVEKERQGILSGEIKTREQIESHVNGATKSVEHIKKIHKGYLNALFDIAKLEEERKQRAEAMQELGFGEEPIKQMNQAYRELIEKMAHYEKRVRDGIRHSETKTQNWREINANVKQANHYLDRAAEHTARASRNARGLGQTIREAFQEAFTLEKVANRIAFVITAKLSYDAFKYFHRGLREGVRLAMQFEDTMERVYSLLGEMDSVPLRREFAEAARSSMVRYAQSIENTNMALYNIISAQIDANHAADVLNNTMRLAVAEFTDVNIATDAVTTTLNAYNLEATRAADVSDLLSTIVTQGKTTLEELAPVWGRVAAVGGMFNVQIEDLAANLAIMTQQGLSASEATTAMRQLLLTIMQPSEKAKELIRDYGLEMDATTLRTQGMIYIAEQLARVQDEEVITTLASSRRGIMALAGAMSDTERYARTYDEILNRAGATQEKFAGLSETTSFKMEQMKSQFAYAALELGEGLLPAMSLGLSMSTDLAGGFAQLVKWMNQFELQSIALVAVLAKLTPMMLANPYLAVASGVALLAGVIGRITRANNELMEQLDRIRQENIESIRVEMEQLSIRRDALTRLIELEEQVNRTADAERELIEVKKQLGAEFENVSDAIANANSELARIDLEQARMQFKLYREEVNIASNSILDAMPEISKAYRRLEKEADIVRIKFLNTSKLYGQIHSIAANQLRTSVDQQISDLNRIRDWYDQQYNKIQDQVRERDFDAPRRMIAELNIMGNMRDEISGVISMLEDRIDAESKLTNITEQETKARVALFAIAEDYQSLQRETLSTSQQWLDAERLANRFGKEMGQNAHLQRLFNQVISEGVKAGTEGYNSLIGLLIQYQRELDKTADEEVRPEFAPRAIREIRNRLEEQLAVEQDIAANRAREEIELAKIRREHERIRDTIMEIDEKRLPEGYLKNFIALQEQLFKLEEARLTNQLRINNAQQELNSLIERQRLSEEATKLGFDVDVQDVSPEEIIEAYDKLISARREAGEETARLELDLLKALEEIRRRELSDIERYAEDRFNRIEEQLDREALMRQQGLKDLRKHGIEEQQIMEASYRELMQMLHDMADTEESRFAIQFYIDKMELERQSRAYQEWVRNLERDILEYSARSPLPSAIVDMVTGRKRERELRDQLGNLVEGTQEYLQTEEQLLQIAHQRRVESERFIANQLRDIWSSYLQIRRKQINDEHQQAVDRIQSRYELEFRSRRWLDAEMEKLDEENAKREAKLRKQEQIATLAQATMNIALAVTKALPNLVLAGLVSALGSVQLGIIASQTFASGGYTGKSSSERDHTGERPVGVVHEEEYVFNKHATRGNVQLLDTMHELLQGKGSRIKAPQVSKGFATGGYTGRALGGGGFTVDGWTQDQIRELISAVRDVSVLVETETITPVKVSKLADLGRATRERMSV